MENMDPIDCKEQAVELPSGNQVAPPKGLLPKHLMREGLLEASDAEGFSQLLFHAAFLALCGSTVGWCWNHGYWGLLLLAELPLAIAVSFVFNAFHELVHNTAFKTQALNSLLAQVLGFFIFRGAKWFWCFHWTHHRFTNDPTRDPELSGGSLDLDDPTSSPAAYAAFCSGYPFGFERVGLMFSLARGHFDRWTADKPLGTRRHVQLEAACYCVGYAGLAVAALLLPKLRVQMVLYWLLPHMLGAGHLRLYQFAEHRACTMGKYTDTNAWACARSTATWWLYRKLAWHMPFHVEHHAFPNVPFHKLARAHELVRAAYAEEGFQRAPSGCDPDGREGYVAMHVEMFRRMLGNRGKAA